VAFELIEGRVRVADLDRAHAQFARRLQIDAQIIEIDATRRIHLQRIGRDNVNPAQTQAAVRGVVERSFTSPNERYRAYSQELWNENCEGFAKLHNSTTPAQRQRMLDALRGYESDFKILMGQK
jgi:hypothetical protein